LSGSAFADHVNGAILFAFGGFENSNVVIQNNRSTNDANFVNLFEASNFQILRNKTFDTKNADDANQGSAIRVGGESSGILIGSNRCEIRHSPASRSGTMDLAPAFRTSTSSTTSS
jgi:hypothetical protein